MKKVFVALGVILVICIIGCFLYKPRANHPYEIVKGNSKLSFYDTEDNIKIKGFNVLEYSAINCLDKENNNVLVDQGGIISDINIVDKDVITYKNISVGDDINKIKKTFKYEFEIDNVYYVHFSGDIEIDQSIQKQGDRWISLFYSTDGFKITSIHISEIKW